MKDHTIFKTVMVQNLYYKSPFIFSSDGHKTIDFDIDLITQKLITKEFILLNFKSAQEKPSTYLSDYDFFSSADTGNYYCFQMERWVLLFLIRYW